MIIPSILSYNETNYSYDRCKCYQLIAGIEEGIEEGIEGGGGRDQDTISLAPLREGKREYPEQAKVEDQNESSNKLLLLHSATNIPHSSLLASLLPLSFCPFLHPP